MFHEIIAILRDHRGLGGGGFGLSTPVVSYAPRPMLQGVDSLVIILGAEENVNVSADVERTSR